MTDQTQEATPPEAPVLSAEDAGKLLFLIDCAVRYTPQPQGGINMASEAMALCQKLSQIQQGAGLA